MKNSKYIGLGFCLEHIVKMKVESNYSILPLKTGKISPKISFIVDAGAGSRIAVSAHNTSLDNAKIATFLTYKEKFEKIDKLLYIHFNISINNEDEAREEELLIMLVDNFMKALEEVIKGSETFSIYSVSAYNIKQTYLENISKLSISHKEEVVEFDESERNTNIIRIKNKMIVILLESGSTHIGVIDYKAINRQEIISLLEEREKDIQGNLLSPISCTVIMEPNKEPNRPYMAKVIKLI